MMIAMAPAMLMTLTLSSDGDADYEVGEWSLIVKVEDVCDGGGDDMVAAMVKLMVVCGDKDADDCATV